jgi:HEAT repeat protein
MKGRALNIALALGVSLLTLGSLEGLCRFWERRHPPETVADYLWNWQQKWDGDFYVMDSDAVGWPPWEDFNADGVRDRTHALEKPEGVDRIVFLGDSVTLGDHIRAEEAFPQQLAARFDAESRPAEVFNISLLGWSTRQERIAYQRIARRYHPDDVVLAVCLNDIAELQNNLARPPRWLAAVHARSALVRLAVNAQGREIGNVEELFTRGDSAKVREAMQRFFGEVRALRDEAKADGARFAMIVFPFRFQVRPGAPEPRVQREIATFAASEKIAFADLLPVLLPMGDAAFVDYDHLSAAGARRTADAILATGLLPVPPSVAASTDDAVVVETLRHDPSEHARMLAAQTLGKMHVASAAPALFDALGDPRTSVRWAAAFALYEIQPPVELAIPRLIAAVESPDDYVRAFATWTLGNIGEPAAPAVPALTRALALAKSGAYSQGGAALALGKIGAAAAPAVPALTQALAASDNRIRRMAARSLGRIGRPATAAVPALLRASADKEDEYLRGIAVRALGRIAPGQSDVVTALQTARRDGNPEVRRQAEIALRGR